MTILYLHQYFKTPEEGGAIRSYHIAKAMLVKGHQVEMITSHNHSEYVVKNIEGIIVHYLPVFYENKLGKLGRIFAFLKFLYLAFRQMKRINNIDLCYATSTPLTVGLLALWLKFRRKIPFIFEIRDLWPLAPIQLGFIKNPILQKCLFFLETNLYQKAQKVIVLSQGSFDYVAQQIPIEKIILAPNMSDCDFFEQEVTHQAIFEKYNLQHRFVISYLGTLGKANHLEYLIEIAEICQKEIPEILFLIVGEGAEKDKLINKSVSIKNIEFLPTGNKEYMREIMHISQATYTSFLNLPVLQTNSPNKFFDSLAAGKLTIVNTAGWLQEIVENNQCGFYANPSYPHLFVEKVKSFVYNKELLTKYQQNALKTAHQFFSKEKIVSKIVDNLQK